ncbi:MAG: UpxY family transcription antiterminator [Flavitalea sp.]
MPENVNWYAVYTKPRWEKKVAELLARKKIETYCPLNRVHRQWSDRKKIILEPLFTSYVFVRIADAEQLAVRMTDGVLNFVYWLAKPAVIKDEEIDIIKKFLNDHDNVQIEKTFVNVNDHVRVISGPLMMREGNVVEVKHKTVKVSLPTLGYTLIAEVDKQNLEKLSDPSQSYQEYNP